MYNRTVGKLKISTIFSKPVTSGPTNISDHVIGIAVKCASAKALLINYATAGIDLNYTAYAANPSKDIIRVDCAAAAGGDRRTSCKNIVLAGISCIIPAICVNSPLLDNVFTYGSGIKGNISAV